MKRTIFMAALLLCFTGMQAADKEGKLGASVGLGSTGITLDLQSKPHPLIGLRFGLDYMPSITMKHFDIAVSDGTGNAKGVYERMQPEGLKKPETVLVNARPGWFTGHFLADFYIHRDKGFHFTAGLYFTGSDHFMTMKNKHDGWFNDIYDFNNSIGAYTTVDHSGVGYIGIKLDDGTILGPSKEGNMRGKFQVWKARPYIGVGYDGKFSNKNLGWSVDAGMQIWGTPKAYIMNYTKQGNEYHEVFPEDLSGKAHTAVKRAKTLLKVYPCVTFRLNCNFL